MKILNRLGRVIYENENIDNIKELVEEAVREDIGLASANLIDADLRGTNLEGAILIGADLTGARLEGDNLTCANLRYADRNRDEY